MEKALIRQLIDARQRNVLLMARIRDLEEENDALTQKLKGKVRPNNGSYRPRLSPEEYDAILEMRGQCH